MESNLDAQNVQYLFLRPLTPPSPPQSSCRSVHPPIHPPPELKPEYPIYLYNPNELQLIKIFISGGGLRKTIHIYRITPFWEKSCGSAWFNKRLACLCIYGYILYIYIYIYICVCVCSSKSCFLLGCLACLGYNLSPIRQLRSFKIMVLQS